MSHAWNVSSMKWITSVFEFRDKGKLAEFESGQIFEMDNIEVKDAKTLERLYVKARLCRDRAKLPQGEVLGITDFIFELMSEPGGIEVLEKLESPYDAYLK